MRVKNMFVINLSDALANLNPAIPVPDEKKLNKVIENFGQGFAAKYINRISKEGYRHNEYVINHVVQAIFEEELAGILSSDQRVTTKYYDEFNREVAFSLHNRLDPDTHRYGGYSVRQIVYDIKQTANEISQRKKEICTSGHPYRLDNISIRICDKINMIFANYRREMRKKYISHIDEYNYGPLNPMININHPDPVLRNNAVVQKICHMPVNESAKYLSFPVAIGKHISDEIKQRENINAFTVPIVNGYGQPGGCTVLLVADPGTGKTYYMVKDIAPIIGEMCNCGVYITLPMTSQLEQARQIYGCDVRFREGIILNEGSNPNIRAYVYDCVMDIPAITEDPATGAGRPNILIIDEAHSLLTEQYRGQTLHKIVDKSREILSAGGVVIAMSASWELIAGTMPYNTMMGYDLICHIFRVSSTAPLNDTLSYPYYTYEDVVKNGKDTGVDIVSAIPADTIRILYQNPEDKRMSFTLASLILQKLSDGKKVMAEYNNIDMLTEVKNILSMNGYRATVCSSNDKDFERDKIKRKNIYNNKVYNDILNDSCIDFGSIDVVLTTKLLENGTTIDSTKGDMDEYNITSIFVAEKRNQFNLEAFIQFSGRLRFRHAEAILLMKKPDEGSGRTNNNMYNRLDRNMGRIQNISDKLIEHMITYRRLHDIDFNGLVDLPDGLDEKGIIDAKTISKGVYKATNDFYRALTYDRQLMEKTICDRFAGKNVIFAFTEPAGVGIKSAEKEVSEEGRKAIKEAITSTLSDPDIRDSFIYGSDNDGCKKKLELIKKMNDYSRAAYIKTVKQTLSVVFTLQDIDKNTKKLPKAFDAVPKTELDDCLHPESFCIVLENAIIRSGKKDLQALTNLSMAEGFKYLSKFDNIHAVVYRYAIQYGDSNYHIDELVAECVAGLPKMPTELKKQIIALMNSIFKNEKKKRIDRLLYSCRMMDCKDMNFYSAMSVMTDTELDQISQAYEFMSYAITPILIHADDTASGATFSIITGAKAYAAITGLPKSSYEGISSWSGKTITKERCHKIYNLYKDEMKRQGFKYDASETTGRLKVLRLFAAIFTYEQRVTDRGEVYIVLGKLRNRRPRSYDQIIHLNFRKKTENS